MRLKHNPFTGTFDFVNPTLSTVDVATKVADTFICEESAAIGDIVVADQSVSGKVLSLTTNSYTGLAFGVIINKPSSLICEVLISGKLSNVDGAIFEISKPVFINGSGKFSTDVPLTGDLQVMGIATATSNMFLIPSTNKVTRS